MDRDYQLPDLGLDEVLPFYVDYVGRFEQDEVVTDASAAVIELVRGGNQAAVALAKDAELTLGELAVELRHSTRDKVRLGLE